jgi:hypothetical protein
VNDFSLGSLPDWLVALFTGISAFILWRTTRPRTPVVEVEWMEWGEWPRQLTLTIRNPDPEHVAIVKEVIAKPETDWRIQCASHSGGDFRIRPKTQEAFRYSIGGQAGRVTSTSMPTIQLTILCNRRRHIIRIKH